MVTVDTSRRMRRTGVICVVLLAVAWPLAPAPVSASAMPDIPPAVDPGIPTYAGEQTPVPEEPVAYDSTTSMLAAIHDADVAAGGDAFWFDRILERPAGRVLERCIDLAQDHGNVPGERTRRALVDAAEHLLAQLRGPATAG